MIVGANRPVGSGSANLDDANATATLTSNIISPLKYSEVLDWT
jgi:hypothetical protein